MSFNSFTGLATGGLINPNSPNYLGAASKANRMTQAQIDQGQQALNATYFGGSYPMYSQVGQGAYSPGQSYYRVNRQGGYVPYTGKGGTNAAKKGKLFAKTDSGYQKGYTPEFYQGIANDYIKSAIPQLAQQQKQTSDAIKYGLFNRGLSKGSSAYGTAMSDLNQATGKAEQQVADNALSAARGTQSQVMSAYQNAINSLYNTANPGQAAQQGVASAAQFSVPQTFTPISNMFSSLANDYATRLLYSQAPITTYTTPYMNQGGSTQFLGPTSYGSGGGR